MEERCGEGDGEIARRRSGSEVQGALRALAAVLHDGRSSHLRHDLERGDEAGGEAVRGKGEHGEIEADHGNHDAFEVSDEGCLTMNTRRFEDLFYRFSLRPSLFICERFSRHSSSVQMQFARFSNTFCGTDFYGTFSALHGSLRQACLILGPGWVRRGREPSTPRRALSCLPRLLPQ